MSPLEKFYVEMCNWANEAIAAECLLGQLSDEQVQNLAGLVGREIGDKTPPVALALIRAVVDDELLLRSSADRRSEERRGTSVGEVPF